MMRGQNGEYASTGGPFRRYVEEATEECRQMSSIQKGRGLWNRPEILEYYARLPDADEINTYLSRSMRDVLPDTENRNILVVGGGAGRLGRTIAKDYSGISVADVDSSEKMVSLSNRLSSERGLDGRFKSQLGDAFKIPYGDGEFDYAMAQGFIRYFPLEDQLKLFGEMQRVSAGGSTIAEGKDRDTIYALKEALPADAQLIETSLPMFRMSLFFMLLKRYERDPEFRDVTKSYAGPGSCIDVLGDLAGTSDGTLYELRIR